MKMKNKIIPIAVIALIVILVGIWVYPSNDSINEKSDDITGTVVSTEETEEMEEIKSDDLDEISGTALIGKCISECGDISSTDLEQDIWKSICNKKYSLGEEEIREFIRTC